jgi:hypothetical protein
MAYTTDDLIAGIKRRASIPTGQGTFQPADFLALADGEIRTSLLPTILKARSSYYSFDYDQAIQPTNAVYSVPTRAIGVKLDGIYVLDASGKRFNLNLIEEEEVFDPNVSPNGNPSFYFKGNSVVLVPPNPSGFTTLRMAIFIRPGSLAQTSACAQIQSINTGTNTLTFSAVPSTFTTATPLDLIKQNPHYDYQAVDQTPQAVTATTIQFSQLPAGLAAGDWVALSGQSPVVQIPLEYQPVLEQRVANACSRAQGMQAQLAAGKEALSEMNETFLLITPRAEKEPKKIVNRSGMLRRGY